MAQENMFGQNHDRLLPNDQLHHIRTGNILILPIVQTHPDGWGVPVQSIFNQSGADLNGIPAYLNLKTALEANADTSPGEIFTHPANYQDYLRLYHHLLTGQPASDQNILTYAKFVKGNPKIPIEDKLVTIPAALIGIGLTTQSGGKNGTNHINDLTSYINALIGGATGAVSPLCAQYEVFGDTATGSKNTFVESIDSVATSQIMRWTALLHLTAKLRNEHFAIQWATLSGDSAHMQSVVPPTIKHYGQTNQLAKMLLLLDRHLWQLQELAAVEHLPLSLTDLNLVENETEATLTHLYANNWRQLETTQLESLINQLEHKSKTDKLSDQEKLSMALLNITIHEVLPEVKRFYGTNGSVAKIFNHESRNLADDLANLSAVEMAEWGHYRQFTSANFSHEALAFLESAKQAIVDQGNLTLAGLALHEAVLYFVLGKTAATNQQVVLGLDIDHASWMTLCWKLGYNSSRDTGSRPKQITSSPIIYASENFRQPFNHAR